jgi:hypothetical protein
MSSRNIDAVLQRYLIIGGALGIGYLIVHYLSNDKKVSLKKISLDETRSIIKEIKYQLYASCISFVEGVNSKLKANYPQKDLEVFLRTDLTKTYDAKEDLILVKYMVSKDEYALALDKYKKDGQVKSDQEEIFKLLEDSVKGNIDLTVPVPVTENLSRPIICTLKRR